MAEDVVGVEVQFKAAVADLQRALKEMQNDLKGIEGTAKAAEPAVKQAFAQEVVQAFTNHVKAAVRELHEMHKAAEKIGSTLRSVATGPAGIVTAITGLLGAAGLTKIISDTIEWDRAVVHLSHAMNDNTIAASEWLGVGRFLGVQTEQMSRMLSFFSKNIDDNSKTLKEMGVATVDASGKLLSMDTILKNSTHWFHEHQGSTLAAARAKELFGRTGTTLLPILTAEQGQFERILQLYKDYGLILDRDTIQKHRLLELELRKTGVAFQGVAYNLGAALLPAVAAVGHQIAAFIKDNLGPLQQALLNVISVIMGILKAFGLAVGELKLELSDVSDAATDFGDAADTMGSKAHGAAAAERNLRDAVREHTRVLEDQIKAIEDEERIFDRQIQQRIRLLELQGAEEHAQDRLLQLTARGGDERLRIQRLQREQQLALQEGDLTRAEAIFVELTSALNEQSQTARQIEFTKHEEKRRLEIDSLRQTLDSHKEQARSLVEAKQREIRATQDAAERQLEAMRGAAEGSLVAWNGAHGGIAAGAALMGAKTKTIMIDMNQKAFEVAEGIKSFFGGAWDYITQTFSQPDPIAKMGHDLGKAMGEAFLEGMGHGIGGAIRSGLTSVGSLIFPQPTLVTPFFGGGAAAGFSAAGTAGEYQAGGIVSGRLGQPRMILAHAGERIQTREEQAQQVRGAGLARPVTVNVNIAGNVDSSDRVEEIERGVSEGVRKAFGVI